MSERIIGNVGGTWGIIFENATPQVRQQAHEENYWGTLLIVSVEEAEWAERETEMKTIIRKSSVTITVTAAPVSQVVNDGESSVETIFTDGRSYADVVSFHRNNWGEVDAMKTVFDGESTRPDRSITWP